MLSPDQLATLPDDAVPPWDVDGSLPANYDTCSSIGDRVEVLWDRDGKYYPGVITADDGEEATILYDTGHEETVALADIVFNFL